MVFSFFPVGTTHCQSKSQCSSLCLLTLIPAFSHRRAQAAAQQYAVTDYHRHAGMYLPLSCSPASLEGVGIPPASLGSGFSCTWPLSAFLGKTCPLICGQLLYFIWTGTWFGGLEHSVYACLIFFYCFKTCCFPIQEPSEGFNRGEICYKIHGRKTILDVLQLLSGTYIRVLGFFFLLSRQQRCLD